MTRRFRLYAASIGIALMLAAAATIAIQHQAIADFFDPQPHLCGGA